VAREPSSNQDTSVNCHLSAISHRSMQGEIGTTPGQRRERNQDRDDSVTLYVEDSRQGWVKSYQTLLELSSDEQFSGGKVQIDLSDVRPAGEDLKALGRC